MTPHDAAVQRIRSAQTALRQTLDSWTGNDLPSIEKCTRLLENCATDLQEFRGAVLLGALRPTADIRTAVVDVRTQIRKLTTVVDVSSAFVQGLAVYAGARSSTYNAHGQMQQETMSLGAQEF
jgi:hypothetical protein